MKKGSTTRPGEKTSLVAVVVEFCRWSVHPRAFSKFRRVGGKSLAQLSERSHVKTAGLN